VPNLFNCTFARSVDFSHTGDYSYKFIKTIAAGTSANAKQTDGIGTADMHGLIAGEAYDLSYWFYIPTASGILGTECRLMISEYYSAGWHNTTLATAVNTYDAWQEMTNTITLNATTTGVFTYCEAISAAADTEYFYVDDVRQSSHSIPGSHYLSSGYTEHLLGMPDTFTIQLGLIPTFAFDTGSNQELYGWYVSAT